MNFNKIIIAMGVLAGVLCFSSCKEDEMQEITDLQLARILSPTELSAVVVNKTGVRLSWREVPKAETYTIEFFENADFSGSASRTVEGVTMAQVPYTVTGLDGETEYFIRVKAIGEAADDSKWVSATVTTAAEQIFQNVNISKLQATSVTLNWPAGETATSIRIMPGDIVHAVTPQEVAAGEAVVTGLTGETVYTATLLRNAKVRGIVTFTTLLDLQSPAVTVVSPGADLSALLSNAAQGQVFGLTAGTYTVNSDVVLTKSIKIKGARPDDKPVIKGLVIRLASNAGLELKDLVLDGTGSSGNQTIVYNEDSTAPYGDLKIMDCEIKNYVKGLLYVSKKALIESVTFRGNIIHDIECSGGDFIDFRSGLAKTFLFENNTVYNSALARDLFRMDSGGSTNFPGITSNIIIRTNTFNKVSNSNRFLYIRLASHTISFNKNIIANTNGQYTNQAATTITEMEDNNYFNAPNFTASTTSGAQNDTGDYTTLDPGFPNPDGGIFTVNNFDLKLNGIGDARWR